MTREELFKQLFFLFASLGVVDFIFAWATNGRFHLIHGLLGLIWQQ